MIENLISSPRAFIREQTKYRGTRTQTVVVIAVGLAFALQHIGTYLQLGDAGIDVYEVIVINVGVGLLVPFLIWLAAAFLIALSARVLAGRLTIGEVFQLGGWGLLPLLASGLVQSAGRLYALRGAEPPELGMYAYLGHEWEQYQLYLQSANADPVFVAATAVAVLFVLYTGYIWAIVVQELERIYGTDVELSIAVLISAVPTLLCLAWVLSPFIL